MEGAVCFRQSLQHAWQIQTCAAIKKITRPTTWASTSDASRKASARCIPTKAIRRSIACLQQAPCLIHRSSLMLSFPQAAISKAEPRAEDRDLDNDLTGSCAAAFIKAHLHLREKHSKPMKTTCQISSLAAIGYRSMSNHISELSMILDGFAAFTKDMAAHLTSPRTSGNALLEIIPASRARRPHEESLRPSKCGHVTRPITPSDDSSRHMFFLQS